MNDQLPDIGLTAHGYVLDLMGESQQLANPHLVGAVANGFHGQPFLGKKTPGTV